MRSLALAVPLAVALVGAAACGDGRPAAGVVSGHVETTEIRVAPKVGGRIARLLVKEGDRVAAGQPLAEIDSVDLRLALDAARAERSAAEADLRLKRTGARPEDIAEARANVASLKADLDGAQRDLDRMQQLLDSGSGTPKSRDDAATRRDSLRARLAAAEQALRRLETGFRAEEKDASAARAEQAAARAAQLEQQIGDCRVVAPAAGVITHKAVEQGEMAAPGATLLVLSDLSDTWLTVYVGEPELPRVSLGQAVEVTTDGGQRRQGKVSFVASEAEFTPKNVQTRDERVKLVYRVKVALPNDDGMFKAGMPAEARFPFAELGK